MNITYARSIKMSEIEMQRESKEKKIVRCGNCGLTQEFYHAGKFDSGRTRWVNSDGKLANGKVCGDCNIIRARLGMRKSRELKFIAKHTE